MILWSVNQDVMFTASNKGHDIHCLNTTPQSQGFQQMASNELFSQNLNLIFKVTGD